MNARHALLAALLATATVSTTGCGVLMRFIGERVADAITSKTANLAEVAANISYVTNLYPLEADTYETAMLEKSWKGGANMLTIVFQKRSGVGMYEIDGTVTARKPGGPAEPVPYMGKGAYLLMLQAGDRQPRTIEVRSATGQVATFLAKPAAPVKLKAVNGKAANAAVDLTKDLVIDLDGEPGPGKLKVMLAATTMGIRTMTDVAIVKPAKRFVIPAAAYKHMGVSSGTPGIVGVDGGANYVVVERYEGGSIKAAPAGAAFAMGKSWSHSPVTVSGDVKNAAGLAVSGSASTPRGGVTYSLHKNSAFYAPVVTRADKIAVGSLVVRGHLYKKDVSVKETSTHIITTTTTYAFPPVAPAAWDRLLDDAVAGLPATFRAAGAAGTIVPAERVVASAVYQSMEAVPEQVGEKYVERAYRKTRHVFPESFANMLGSVSSTFALDRPVVRLMHEVGADAVLDARINLQIGAFEDTKQLALIPSMSFQLWGPNNGYTVGPTHYAGGTVTASQGVPFSGKELEDLGALRRVARLDDLLAGMKAGLLKLREEERKAGYDAIWALQ